MSLYADTMIHADISLLYDDPSQCGGSKNKGASESKYAKTKSTWMKKFQTLGCFSEIDKYFAF